jgi:hypothetical protein
MMKLFGVLITSFLVFFGAMPSSTSYKLNNYSFGNGGAANSTSTNYGLNGVAGEQSGTTQTGTAYKNQPGENNTQNAAVPTVTITNPSTYYNKLLVTISPGSAASDTLYAVAISTDNFTTTNYVKSDNTVTASLTYPTDYRTYAGWGSGSGTLVIGLTPSTTYYVKAKAMQGKYTESAYGPVSSVATSPPSLTVGIATISHPSPPFSIGFGTLTIGASNNATDQINLTMDTNAEAGGNIWIASQFGALTSARTGGTIPSVNGNLSSVDGWGAQGSGATQTSGGPFTIVGSNYNGSGNNVGALTTTYNAIFTTSNPVVGGSGSILLKARPNATTPSASDYAETLTISGAGLF